MRKKMRHIANLLLVFTMILSLCACGQTTGTVNSNELELDYVGEEVVQKEEEETPWYAWVSDAFSFGKVENTGKENAPAQTQPDSVADFYTQGTTDAQNSTSSNSKADAAEDKNEVGNSAAENNQNVQVNQNDKKDEVQADNNTNEEDAVVEPEKPSSSKETVIITIRCDTAVNNGMHLESKWAGIVPASGCILPETTVEIEEGDTVFDVLSQVCDKYKIHMEYRGGTTSGCYVEGINNLYEFDGGRWSGWMYAVDDWYPNYGCGVYYVSAGQVIEWNYTCDLGLDLDGSWWEGAQDWKDNHE